MMQTNGMKEQEREAFLEEFSEQREKSLVGFCAVSYTHLTLPPIVRV